MTENKAGGILLMLIGIIITTVWIAVYAFLLYDEWYTFNIVYGKYICTYWEHFFAVSKTQLVLSFIAGSFFCAPGIYFFFKQA